MKIGTNGLSLIKSFEGCRLTAYKCPAGVWTIGYGHTGKVDGKAVATGMTISSAKATELLKSDLESFSTAVNKCVTVDITQNQFDALVSFAYNCGSGALNGSTLLKKINAGLFAEAAKEFAKWNKAAGTVLAGLTRRRAAEAALFMDGILLKPTKDLPLRNGSGPSHKCIIKIPAGKRVKLLEQTKPNYWQVKVTLGGTVYKGYCNSKYLK